MTDQRSERYFRLRWKLYYGDDAGFDQWWSRLADKQSRRTRAAEGLRSRRAAIKKSEVSHEANY